MNNWKSFVAKAYQLAREYGAGNWEVWGYFGPRSSQFRIAVFEKGEKVRWLPLTTIGELIELYGRLTKIELVNGQETLELVNE